MLAQPFESLTRMHTRSIRQALFDYTATEADELTLTRGETMVICGSPEEGWYECELRGRVGMVPANYVRLLHAADLRWVCEIHDACSFFFSSFI